METKSLLLEQAKSCIRTLEAYILDEEVTIVTPSIVIDDEPINKINGRVNYEHIQMTDDAFENYCTGLIGLCYHPGELVERYNDLRIKCNEIFGQRRR